MHYRVRMILWHNLLDIRFDVIVLGHLSRCIFAVWNKAMESFWEYDKHAVLVFAARASDRCGMFSIITIPHFSLLPHFLFSPFNVNILFDFVCDQLIICSCYMSCQLYFDIGTSNKSVCYFLFACTWLVLPAILVRFELRIANRFDWIVHWRKFIPLRMQDEGNDKWFTLSQKTAIRQEFVMSRRTFFALSVKLSNMTTTISFHAISQHIRFFSSAGDSWMQHINS